MRFGNAFFFILAIILTIFSKNTQSADILEGPTTQYALIGTKAIFTCKTAGREAFWTLNGGAISITYPERKQIYQEKGVVFMENHTQEYHNLTMIIDASLDLNNTQIFCSVLGSDFTIITSDEVYLMVFSTLSPYSPAVTVNISYIEHPIVIAKIVEIPRWPGYEIKEFRMNVTNAEDNTLLGRFNASAGNGTVEIKAQLPNFVKNKCAKLKISASVVSEQYGEGEPTVVSTELYYQTPDLFSDIGVTHTILPHTNDSYVHISFDVELPDVCKNQQLNYSFIVKSNESLPVVKTQGPFTHYGPGNVSHCIDGLAKNNSYLVMVQVESITGNQYSEWTYLDTSGKSLHSTTNLNTSLNTGNLSVEVAVLVVILVVMLVILLGVSGVLMWFCHNHNKLMRKFHCECSATVMPSSNVYLQRLNIETISPVSPSRSQTQSNNPSPDDDNTTPLSTVHYKRHGKEFACKGKDPTLQTHPQELEERYVMSPADHYLIKAVIS